MKPWILLSLLAGLAGCHVGHIAQSQLHSSESGAVLKILGSEKNRFFNVYGNQAIEVLHCGDYNQSRAVLNLPAKTLNEASDYLTDDEFNSLTLVKDLNLDCEKKVWNLSQAFRGNENLTMRVAMENGATAVAQVPLVCSGILQLTGWEALDDAGKVDYREPLPAELDGAVRLNLACGSGQSTLPPVIPPTSQVDNDGWDLASTYQAVDNNETEAMLIEMTKGPFAMGVAAIDGIKVEEFLRFPGDESSPKQKAAAKNLAELFNLQQDLNKYDLMRSKFVVEGLVGKDKPGGPILDLCWNSCQTFQPKHFYYNKAADGSVTVMPITNLEARRTISTHPDSFGRAQIEWSFRENPRTTIVLDPKQEKILRALGLKVIDEAAPNFNLAWNPYTRAEKGDPAFEFPFKAESKNGICQLKLVTIPNRYMLEDAIANQCGRELSQLSFAPQAETLVFSDTLVFDKRKFSNLSKVVFEGGTQPMRLMFKPSTCASCDVLRPGILVDDEIVLELRNVSYDLDVSAVKDSNAQFVGIQVRAATALLDRMQIKSSGRAFDIGVLARSSSEISSSLLLKSVHLTAGLGISSDGLLYMRKASDGNINKIEALNSYGLVLSGDSQSYLSDLSVVTGAQGIRVLGRAQVLLHNSGLSLQTDTGLGSQAGISLQSGKAVFYKSEVVGFRFGLRKEAQGEHADVLSSRSKFCVSTMKSDQSNRISLSPSEIPVLPETDCNRNYPSSTPPAATSPTESAVKPQA